MAGAKKKKKPAANPARGFATTSVASKYRQLESEDASDAKSNAPPAASIAPPTAASGAAPSKTPALSSKDLSPEEFEKQLEESELQLLVEKYAAKVRRDANRQRNRLETDRRVLRSQADPINTKKWLPQDLLDQLLHVIDGESRFASSSVSSESSTVGRVLPEEDLTIKLWTLQSTLYTTGFARSRVDAVLRYILDISPSIATSAKDSMWGLEEALDWLARECANRELPDYEKRLKQNGKQLGQLLSRSTTFNLSQLTPCLHLRHTD
jgi:ATP-dependent RNA helicase DHX29